MTDLDELAHRRRSRRETGTRRAITAQRDTPHWVTTFVIPRDACEACAQHWHHKCWGVDLLLSDEERPDCPCDCGDRRDPMRLNARAWADMAVYCPEKVWEAAQAERMREGVGVFVCAWKEDGSGLRSMR